MFNKEEVKNNFSRGAENYDRHTRMHRKLAQELFLSVKKLRPKKILDLGCGTGYLTYLLAKYFKEAEVIGIDLAPGMIAAARKTRKSDNLSFSVEDAEKLPFAEPSFDLIVSNASLQWTNAEKVFRGVRKVLAPGGHFFFTTFGPQTLRELKESGFRVNKFIPAKELKKILIKNNFKNIYLKTKIIRQKFKSVKKIIFYLKEIGAQTTSDCSKPSRSIFKALRHPISASFEAISARVF